ncbi:MAG TPA: serine hydrolase domain-containing protein [Gemmatimonadaceae bacterium]
MRSLQMLRMAALCAGASVVNPMRAARAQKSNPADFVHHLHRIMRDGSRSDSTFDILERMRVYHVPGVSLAVIDGSRIVFARGYGVKEFGTKQPVDTTTIFLAGSISKPVFASGVMSLIEQHKLALDEDVNHKLTSWKLPPSRFTAQKPVTLRELLTHSAGLTIHGFPGYAIDAPLPTVPQVLDGAPPANTKAVRNDTTPGALWRYSGGGITIAQLLSTDVTHEPFPALMQRLVLGPAKMIHSTYENPLPKSRWRDAASGHEKIDTVVPGKFHVYPEMAAAGLWTTAPDLARWAIAVSDAYKGRAGMFISPVMAKQMISRQVLVDAKDSTSWWGLGVGVIGSGPQVEFSHGGRDEGFVANFDMWPVRGQGLVVLTNGVAGGFLNELSDAFREAYSIKKP